MIETLHYKFKKPGANEAYAIDVPNANTDRVDEVLYAKADLDPVTRKVRPEQLALDFIPNREKGAALGVATLDATGKVVGARPAAWVPAWGDVTGKPSVFAPAGHSHAQGDVTGLLGALALKADAATALKGGAGFYMGDDVSNKKISLKFLSAPKLVVVAGTASRSCLCIFVQGAGYGSMTYGSGYSGIAYVQATWAADGKTLEFTGYEGRHNESGETYRYVWIG